MADLEVPDAAPPARLLGSVRCPNCERLVSEYVWPVRATIAVPGRAATEAPAVSRTVCECGWPLDS